VKYTDYKQFRATSRIIYNGEDITNKKEPAATPAPATVPGAIPSKPTPPGAGSPAPSPK
jgi:hypothetical protein